MTEFAIHLLGKFQITRNGQPLTTLSFPRSQSLLAYLALHRREPQARQHLAFRFWPDSSEAQARTNLRKQLLYLRQTLPDSDLLISNRHTVQLNPAADLWVDVTAFKQALIQATTGQACAATAAQTIAALRDAVALYTGDLLPDCYEDWVLPEREALRAAYLNALERLVHLLEAARAYADVLVYAQQLLQHDPLHEPTYRQLMRIHALHNDRAAALRVYHTCVTQLQSELDVEPDPETHALYEQLRGQQRKPDGHHAQAANIPFVGRSVEWQQLQQIWRRSSRGHAHVALIAGEAGIGKSRLAEELLAWAHHQGIATATTRSYAAEGSLAYAPVVTWLRSAALAPRLTHLEPEWQTELARLLPELTTAQTPVATAPMQSWQRHRLFEALARAFLVNPEPLLLVLDDLQWCDQETLEWLHYVMRYAPTAKLLIVVTARSEEIAPADPLTRLLHELRHSSQLSELELSPLSATEMGELVRQMTTASFSDDDLTRLYRESEGHPLFIVEMVHAQDETPLNDKTPVEGGPAPHTNPLAPTPPALPAKIQNLIATRLARLSPTARKVAGLAATIGREFTFAVLAAASDADEADLVDALDELWQRRIIREQGTAAYDFSHDKLREVSYGELSTMRRCLFHRRIATALETLYATAFHEVAAQLGHHYEQAALSEQAIHYYRQAAAAAMQLYASHDAVHALERALNLLQRFPPSLSRAQTEYAILVEFGPPMVAAYSYLSRLREYYLRARQLAHQLGYAPNAAVLRILAINHAAKGEITEAHTLGRQLLELAQQETGQERAILQTEAGYVLGIAAFWFGQFQASQAHFRQGIASYDPTQYTTHVTYYGQDAGVVNRIRLALTLGCLGYADQALAACTDALALARQLAHPFSLHYALNFATWLYNDRRDRLMTQAMAEALIAHDSQHQMSHVGAGISYTMQGWVLVQQEAVTEGLGKLDTGLAYMKRSGYLHAWQPYLFAFVAQAHMANGDAEQGLVYIHAALASLATHEVRCYVSELYRVKGLLRHYQKAPTSEVESCFQQAIDLARQQEAKLLELRATTSLARLWQQQGKIEQAQQLLAPIYAWFTEGFDTLDLTEAKALLVELA